MIPPNERIKTKCGQKCKFWGYDMDGEYCGHPTAFAKSWAGLSLDAMSRKKLCFHGSDSEQPRDELYKRKGL